MKTKTPINIKTNSLIAWLLAARPQTLSAAVIPVAVGSALAFVDEQFKLWPTIACYLFDATMQIAANLINDLYDFLKGSDREDRLGPKRACAEGWITPKAMKWGIAITLLIASLIGLTLLTYAGWELILIGLVCIIFAFLYTTFLSYQGWGDILVILFFGFVPVGGTYYVQTLSWSSNVTAAALVCGFVINTLLVLNNYRDRQEDKKSNKKTLVVRFGEPFGRYFYLLLGFLAAFCCLWFATSKLIYAALLPQIYIFPHFTTWRKMVELNHGVELNMILKETSKNILLMGFLLTIGLLLSV